MAFRIKDLMITVLPPGAVDPLADCGRCTDLTSGCGGCTRIQCSEFPTRGEIYRTPVFDAMAGELMALKARLDCDAGCSRIQCSNYPTRGEIYRPAMLDAMAGELLALRAELRLALEGNPQQPIAMEQGPKTVQEIDALEQHMQEALEELRAERDRLTNAPDE